MNRRENFFVFEGIDGSGKSTQISLLYKALQEMGIPSVMLFEPTAGEYGQRIRSVLKGDESLTPDEQVSLFILDREHDVKYNILPALHRGETVLMDRYMYSNAAYQGALGIDPDEILEANRKMKFPEPERVWFIDIPVITAGERLSQRNGGSNEIFEKEPFLERVRENYLRIADERFMTIGALGAPEALHEIILADYIKTAERRR